MCRSQRKERRVFLKSLESFTGQKFTAAYNSRPNTATYNNYSELTSEKRLTPSSTVDQVSENMSFSKVKSVIRWSSLDSEKQCIAQYKTHVNLTVFLIEGIASF